MVSQPRHRKVQLIQKLRHLGFEERTHEYHNYFVVGPAAAEEEMRDASPTCPLNYDKWGVAIKVCRSAAASALVSRTHSQFNDTPDINPVYLQRANLETVHPSIRGSR